MTYDLEPAREAIRAAREVGRQPDVYFAAIGLLSECERLRARVAELEAGEIQFGVRWTGPRWQGGEVETDPNFTVEGIRSYIADYEPDEHGVAVQRRVGPWLPIDADAAPSVPSGEETP